MIVDPSKLALYRELNFNVLLRGARGVGKTAMIQQAFAGLNSEYFSAATLDPWVDIIGVPSPVDDPVNGGRVLELVRPEFIKAGKVEAIFFDELNRAPDKILNAVMELIQFKSINGYRLPNLKMVWAAVNPEDDSDYATNRLDLALLDRFHVHIDVPYRLDEEYLNAKYPKSANAFIGWWNNLPKTIQAKVSPRRVDYAAAAHEAGCSLHDFLNFDGVNVSELMKLLKSIPFSEELKQITNAAQAVKFIMDINNATKLLKLTIAKDPVAIDFFQKYKNHLPQELVSALVPAVKSVVSGTRTSTVAELLPTLTEKIGSIELTCKINEIAFVYQNGQTLSAEIQREIQFNTAGFHKLTEHIRLIMSTAPKPLLERAMFEDFTSTPKKRSNLTDIALLIGAHDRQYKIFSKRERLKISAHTYALDCAASKWLS